MKNNKQSEEKSTYFKHKHRSDTSEGSEKYNKNNEENEEKIFIRSKNKKKNPRKKIGNNVHYIGQVTNDTSVPKTANPAKKGQKKNLASPRIGVGCVILRDQSILLVKERGRWSLPKGGLEAGELVQDGARRETYEETGIVVELRDLAFVVEFYSESWGHHLQFFYTGREVSGELQPKDPDKDIQEAKFVPIKELRQYIKFKPRLISLETWLYERRPRHFVFNLKQENKTERRRVTIKPHIEHKKQLNNKNNT